MKLRILLLLSVLLFCYSGLFGFSPYIPDEYIYFERADSGYDLYIKKIPSVESILLTESQKDPAFKKTNYGLRTPKYYPANSDELRILDGKILHTQYELFSLVDSTVQKHEILGEAFYFFLPETVIYGGAWAQREGQLKIEPGIKINIRLFEKKYADYTGRFVDQWITLRLRYNRSIYRENLIEDFTNITKETEGEPLVLTQEDDLKTVFTEYFPEQVPESADCNLIIILDTTASMKEELPVLKRNFKKMIARVKEKVGVLDVAIILYRDYGEAYISKIISLRRDTDQILDILMGVKVNGGQDIPEAVNEAIYTLKDIKYTSSNRIVFLLGDAPAHPRPRSTITREHAMQVIKDYKIKLYTISLPYK